MLLHLAEPQSVQAGQTWRTELGRTRQIVSDPLLYRNQPHVAVTISDVGQAWLVPVCRVLSCWTLERALGAS